MHPLWAMSMGQTDGRTVRSSLNAPLWWRGIKLWTFLKRVFTGCMSFLLPHQYCQSTESPLPPKPNQRGNDKNIKWPHNALTKLSGKEQQFITHPSYAQMITCAQDSRLRHRLAMVDWPNSDHGRNQKIWKEEISSFSLPSSSPSISFPLPSFHLTSPPFPPLPSPLIQPGYMQEGCKLPQLDRAEPGRQTLLCNI